MRRCTPRPTVKPAQAQGRLVRHVFRWLPATILSHIHPKVLCSHSICSNVPRRTVRVSVRHQALLPHHPVHTSFLSWVIIETMHHIHETLTSALKARIKPERGRMQHQTLPTKGIAGTCNHIVVVYRVYALVSQSKCTMSWLMMQSQQHNCDGRRGAHSCCTDGRHPTATATAIHPASVTASARPKRSMGVGGGGRCIELASSADDADHTGKVDREAQTR
jgi:hypothetical protein